MSEWLTVSVWEFIFGIAAMVVAIPVYMLWQWFRLRRFYAAKRKVQP